MASNAFRTSSPSSGLETDNLGSNTNSARYRGPFVSEAYLRKEKTVLDMAKDDSHAITIGHVTEKKRPL
jgi:hypothetical protein